MKVRINKNFKYTMIIIIIFLCYFFYINKKDNIVLQFEKTYNIPSIQKIITMNATKYNVDETLMYAIIDLESDWNYNMSNPKSSSKQLAGFIKSTNIWIGNEHLGYDIEHGNVPVEIQIEILAKYLSLLNKKYRNDNKKVLNEYCNEKGYYEGILKRYSYYSNKNNKEKVYVKYN